MISINKLIDNLFVVYKYCAHQICTEQGNSLLLSRNPSPFPCRRAACLCSNIQVSLRKQVSKFIISCLAMFQLFPFSLLSCRHDTSLMVHVWFYNSR